MPNYIKKALDIYVKEIKKIYGDLLKAIILYGSYARGDFNEASDIDTMILVNIPEEKARLYGQDDRSQLICDINSTFNEHVWIETSVHNIDFFNSWKKYMPFFKNVSKDGIILYASPS